MEQILKIAVTEIYLLNFTNHLLDSDLKKIYKCTERS